jgi:hypothetical protein
VEDNHVRRHREELGHIKLLTAQLQQLMPLLFAIYIPLLLGLAALVAIYLIAEIPLRIFFIDPVSEFNAPMYVGLVSNFGVLLWGAAASTSLFGGWLAFKSRKNRESAWFLICFGLISTLLMLDDLYLLHEEVIEDHLHIPQKFVFVAYGVLVLGLLIRFRKIIFDSDFSLLYLAFGFLAISVAVDLFVTPEEFFIFGGFPGRHIIEDGFKLLGIATWSVYFTRTSFQKVSPLLSSDSL